MTNVRETGAASPAFVTVTVTRVTSFFGQPGGGLLHGVVALTSRTTYVTRVNPDSGVSVLLNVAVRLAYVGYPRTSAIRMSANDCARTRTVSIVVSCRNEIVVFASPRMMIMRMVNATMISTSENPRC